MPVAAHRRPSWPIALFAERQLDRNSGVIAVLSDFKDRS
jgi:hypothetical protein